MGLPSDKPDDWGRSLAACLGTFVISAVLLIALMIAVDPYDTGKFGWLGIDGVDDRDTHTATASRARDPQFDSAIIGNSTAQMLHPAKLSQATGLRFVQLYMTGANPRMQLMVLDAFLRTHRQVGALVFVTDPLWCVHQFVAYPGEPDIVWLYNDSLIAYAKRLLTWPAIEHMAQRISIGLGWRKRNEPNGYFSYEDIWHPGVFRERDSPRDPFPEESAAVRETFPEIALLDAAVKRLPAGASVVVVVPPTFHTTVAQPGTAAAAKPLWKADYRFSDLDTRTNIARVIATKAPTGLEVDTGTGIFTPSVRSWSTATTGAVRSSQVLISANLAAQKPRVRPA